ncbi:MAG: mono/diheme cytochrome c family protein/glucose/arabinose dehydrogenase [Candidatus Promineifilaceae bacterium]|jgi:mono/diheme cytochrome c family protein/glucose/arabinose dehydrogenase/lysophospholipase L1-like esterase
MYATGDQMILKNLQTLVLLAATTVIATAQADSPKPFVFQSDDVISLIGNGLPDRMQHDAWVETVLQSELKGKNVSFRNMSFPGDTVDSKPRNKGFTAEDAYLRHVGADVIFAFFGYNESYAGHGSAKAHQDKLVAMAGRLQALKPNGESAPRIVLFSPIAFENTGDPNLPNGIQQNANLAAYAEATRLAALEAGVSFVDLYAPTFQLFESSKERYTINGVHLNEAGDRKIAEIIGAALLGKGVTADSKLAAIRTAVKDKNWHWHNRYHATDGNDVWGGRSGLRFVDGQSNADVLKHELVMLDVMTANRDKVIWAAANGKTLTADDSNVPPPIEVISNIGGKSKSSHAGKEGSSEYLPPPDSLAKIKIPEGYALNVFASEAMFQDLANPVQMQVDSKGRIWAASWNTYPKWEPLKPMNDSLMIFEDTNNDGVADKRIIFAHVHNPLGFEFWGGGVLVTSGPDLLFLKDTDGDDKADVRTVVLQGLGTADTHHAANNLVYGPDGGIYWQSGIFLVNNFEHPWGKSLNSGNSALYRFDPRQSTIGIIAGNNPNPHGTSFDRWGYCYANDGTGGNSFQVRPEGQGFKMHSLLQKEFRPVAADAIVSSSHFPESMQGDFLICNTIGFLGVKQYKLHRDGYEGRKKGEVWGTPGLELIKSEDRNFRPTDAVFGEDGALYVSDWQNVIIGHMQHNIRDPNRDHYHGRILRLTLKDRPLQKPVKIHGESIKNLLGNLKHPVDGVRHRSRVELSAHNSDDVIVATREWMKAFDPSKEDEAHHLLEALWLHQQHNVRDEALLKILLDSPVEHAAIAANTVKHFWHNVDAKGGRTMVVEAEKEPVVKVVVPKHLSSREGKAYKLGAEVYAREAHCTTCHQPDGKGMAAVYPPLVDSPWVTGNEERIAKIVLHGVWGSMDVNGTTYDPSKGVPPMTAFGSILSDKEIAAVLTYTRNSWGNKAPAVSEKTVKRIRSENTDRTIFWKPEELLQAHPFPAE